MASLQAVRVASYIGAVYLARGKFVAFCDGIYLF